MTDRSAMEELSSRWGEAAEVSSSRREGDREDERDEERDDAALWLGDLLIVVKSLNRLETKVFETLLVSREKAILIRKKSRDKKRHT